MKMTGSLLQFSDTPYAQAMVALGDVEGTRVIREYLEEQGYELSDEEFDAPV